MMRTSTPLTPADKEIGKTPARPHHLRTGGLREGWNDPSIYINNIQLPLFLSDHVCAYCNPNPQALTAFDDDVQLAKEVAARLQTAQCGQHARQGRGRRRTSQPPQTSLPRYIPRDILIFSRHPKSLRFGWLGGFSYGEGCLLTLLSLHIYHS